MKMTRLEWRYLQKIALDHPYYDTHKPPLSDAEARVIVQANNTMTGREFVDSVYAKLGMTRPAREKKRLAWLRSIGELFTVPPIRRIAITVVAIVLLAVFFAATPMGRAIAESVVQYVVRLFDTGAAIMSSDVVNDVHATNNDHFVINAEDLAGNEVVLHSVDSLDVFAVKTGKTPYRLPYTCREMGYSLDYGVLLVYRYETPDGSISISQIWNGEEGVTFIDGKGFIESSECSQLYYKISEEDGNITCFRVLENSVLYIRAENTVDLQNLLKLMSE